MSESENNQSDQQPPPVPPQDWEEVAARYHDWDPRLHGHVKRLLDEHLGTPEVVHPKPVDVDQAHAKLKALAEEFKYTHTQTGPVLPDQEILDRRLSEAEFKALREAKPDDYNVGRFDLFQGLSKDTFLQIVSENAESSALALGIYSGSFEGLDQEAADALIAADKANLVGVCLDKFKDVDVQKLGNKLIEVGMGGVVTANFDKFNLDPQYVLDRLLETNQYIAILIGLNKLPPVDRAWLQERLIENDELSSVIHMIKEFPDADKESLAEDALKESSEDDLIALFRNREEFPSVDNNKLATAMINTGDRAMTVFIYGLDELKGLDPEIAYATVAKGGGDYLLQHMDSFAGLDQLKLCDVLLASKAHEAYNIVRNIDHFDPALLQQITEKMYHFTDISGEIIRNFDKFKSLPLDWLANKCAERGSFFHVLQNSELFEGANLTQSFRTVIESQGTIQLFGNRASLTPEQRKSIAIILCEKYLVNDLTLYMEMFEGADAEQVIADYALKNASLNILPVGWDKKYTLSAQALAEAEPLHMGPISPQDFSRYVKELVKIRPKDRPEAIGEAIALVGELATQNIARLITEVLDGSIAEDEMHRIGLSTTGNEGLTELKTICGGFVAELRAVELSDKTIEAITSSNLFMELFKATTRYENSTWGSHDNQRLRNTLAYLQTAEQDGRIVPMDKSYVPSKIVEVRRLQTSSTVRKEKPEWTKDLIGRYTTLQAELKDAHDALSKPQGFTRLFDDLRISVRTLADTMAPEIIDQQLLEAGKTLSEKGRQSIAQRRQDLYDLITPPDASKPDRYPLRTLAQFEQNFTKLAANTELYPAMRKLVFAWAYRKYANTDLAKDVASLSPTPTTESVANMREFVEHIVNQQTFGSYFADKKSANSFRKMTSTRALDEAMQKAQNVGSGDKMTPLQFVPTRGVMMELSGHIADACWAGKYHSIAESIPNMTSVIIKRDPGNKAKEAFAGAGMLMETTSNKGESILLIRGLNPSQTLMNTVSVEDFYEQFIGYAKDMAEKSGRKLAIVIDGQSGEAATNRPVLFGYLAAKKQTLKAVTVNSTDTTFNGYDVSQKSYLIN